MGDKSPDIVGVFNATWNRVEGEIRSGRNSEQAQQGYKDLDTAMGRPNAQIAGNAELASIAGRIAGIATGLSKLGYDQVISIGSPGSTPNPPAGDKGVKR